MNLADWAYHQALYTILRSGFTDGDRTGTGVKRCFGVSLRFDDVANAFPLVTTKALFWRGIVAELLWFLSGSVDVRELQEQRVHIWDGWVKEDGTIGPGYGQQWRRWNSTGEEIDQIARLIHTLKTKPADRRMIVSAWDAGRIDEMALPPCHSFWQVVVIDGRLHLQLHQRSGDMFLGVPFNIASYAALMHILGALSGFKPGSLHIHIADAHIYLNHEEQVMQQLERQPRGVPTLKLKSFESIEELSFGHFELEGYDPHPAIKAPVAV